MGRLLAVSDIHGQFDAFMELLRYVKYSNQDTLVICGDMIDRGPKSAQILDWIIKYSPTANIVPIIGNHEHMYMAYMAGKLSEESYMDKFIGGEATINSYGGYHESQVIEHLKLIGSLPKFVEIDNYIFTHGGLDIAKPLSKQTLRDTAWDDNTFYRTPGIKDKTVIFGHYPTRILFDSINDVTIDKGIIWRDPVYNNKICIDCGHTKKKRLACLDVTNSLEYYYDFRTKNVEVIEFVKDVR